MSTQREALELEQIRASIEEMRANNALASKKVKWYEPILYSAATAGLISLGIAIAELIRN